jgi:hypothetical protein
MNWHKIDWEKINKIFKPIASLDSDNELYWDHLIIKGLKLDEEGNMIGTWESFLNANLPNEDKRYLVHWENTNDYAIGYYDSEENPYFTSINEGIPFREQPNYWCELEEPVN